MARLLKRLEHLMKNMLESKNIADVLTHVDDQTLVIFDVDNTLIEPTQQIGGTAWFGHMLEKFQARGMSEQEAIKQAYVVWIQLQQVIKIKTVETQTASVVKQLHEKNIKTMGLTARGFALAYRTSEQLHSLGIALDANTIHQDDVILDESAGFVKGTLFLDPAGNKGERLFQFFSKINYEPQKILFIDDMPMFLQSVCDAVVAKNIPFLGLRYGVADDRSLTFEPARADEELKAAFLGTAHQGLVESLV